ncbi:uncharacterized protein LOC108624526 [Ceratina calcarata]|uniref:Uncharacterized protein LOC108624526 n=1 Tax=Ceratina calcarata TaxID=156304 RepID=A0AAJ7N631_9HYME|nr:uncharacterized protein LOC108624526 [Ceratina calcarata]
MKIFFTVPLLLLVFLAHCAVSSLPSKSRCPIVRLANGRVRQRVKGRVIRFNCYEGFTLVGNKYATCIRGQWDTPTPVCVNAECPVPAMPEHALMATKYNGAILLYFCEPGYALIGAPEIYCDGRQWNTTVPHCRDTNAAPPAQCDFEKPDICWWEQDPHHDFDWQRHNFGTPSYHIGTGPTHDHTLGAGNEGYYLYIEASGRLENDTARIISPIYNSSYTDSGCFSFWYHMYGATVGTLNVYFKKEKDLLPRLMFSKEGDQGNQWLQGFFNLPKADKGFQIIIEGIRGRSYVSDIAVDDVAILQGDKCRNLSETENEGVTESDYDQIELVNAQQSCRGRCKNSVTYSFTTSVPPTPSEACLCTLDCAEHSICCPDYAEYCVLSYTEEWTEAASQTTVLTRVSVPTARNVTASDVATVRTGFSMNPKDDIDPVTLRPATTSTTTLGSVTNITATLRPIANVTTITSRPVVTTRRTQLPTKSTRRIGTSTVPTKETPFVRPTTTTVRYEPVVGQPDSEASRQDPKKVHRASPHFSLLSIIAMVVAMLAGVSVSTWIAIVVLRKRKTYKRRANGSALSEDSDVRFLTSDEILDFTLARPSENDET